MLLRRAVPEDARAVAECGARFVRLLASEVEPNVDRIEASVRAVIDSGVGIVLDTGSGVGGMLLGMVVPLWFDFEEQNAVELAWWVDPEHRGGTAALRMVHEFEAWAREQGVSRVVLSDVELLDRAPPAGAVIERLGYRLHERAFIKRL